MLFQQRPNGMPASTREVTGMEGMLLGLTSWEFMHALPG